MDEEKDELFVPALSAIVFAKTPADVAVSDFKCPPYRTTNPEPPNPNAKLLTTDPYMCAWVSWHNCRELSVGDSGLSQFHANLV